jgi:hypothetical protein
VIDEIRRFPDDVQEMRRREGISGIDEKKSRTAK